MADARFRVAHRPVGALTSCGPGCCNIVMATACASAVHEDADFASAAAMCARNSMRLAGRSCISVQSVCAHERIAGAFLKLLEAEVGGMRLGDPLGPATDVGTLIDEAAARRVESRVQKAANSGARVITGGKRHGAGFEPTVLTDVEPDMKVVCEEVFGPVVNVIRYETIEEMTEQRLIVFNL